MSVRTREWEKERKECSLVRRQLNVDYFPLLDGYKIVDDESGCDWRKESKEPTGPVSQSLFEFFCQISFLLQSTFPFFFISRLEFFSIFSSRDFGLTSQSFSSSPRRVADRLIPTSRAWRLVWVYFGRVESFGYPRNVLASSSRRCGGSAKKSETNSTTSRRDETSRIYSHLYPQIFANVNIRDKILVTSSGY